MLFSWVVHSMHRATVASFHECTIIPIQDRIFPFMLPHVHIFRTNRTGLSPGGSALQTAERMFELDSSQVCDNSFELFMKTRLHSV